MASIAVKPIIAAEADAAPPSAARPTGPGRCFHCGEPCVGTRFAREDKRFCCQGCLTVHELLKESGLGQFYELSQHPGVRVRGKAGREKWAFLDDPVLQRELLDFSDGGVNRVTFQIPSMHCVACVWLLENLFRLHPGIGESRVNFPRREVSVTYIPGRIALGELAALLSSIGYEPRLSLEALGKAAAPASTHRKQWLQVGVAGFAFGNIMLLSVPAYLGLDSFSGPVFRTLFGWLNLALALPVLIYSASDYWKSAWLAVRQRIVTLDVPIALGLAALYGQSAFEILTGRGEGYLDSLSGLVFFLLCGRVFQQKTHERIAFDRDYRSFFPLSVTRQAAGGEAVVPISQLEVGDILI
ncbi:MAG TPA: heavy metal translocating P-type ATPase metal-binding domain-containing protein, partial [Candidatus Paceibacterota bacterium]|nr:heavy metal translocating P-type ATPase metal-binding domain-containing protein [Candidatus Paceibacterota bacterium]